MYYKIEVTRKNLILKIDLVAASYQDRDQIVKYLEE